MGRPQISCQISCVVLIANRAHPATAGRGRPNFRRPRDGVSQDPGVDSRPPASHRGRLRFVSVARMSLVRSQVRGCGLRLVPASPFMELPVSLCFMDNTFDMKRRGSVRIERAGFPEAACATARAGPVNAGGSQATAGARFLRSRSASATADRMAPRLARDREPPAAAKPRPGRAPPPCRPAGDRPRRSRHPSLRDPRVVAPAPSRPRRPRLHRTPGPRARTCTAVARWTGNGRRTSDRPPAARVRTRERLRRRCSEAPATAGQAARRGGRSGGVRRRSQSPQTARAAS